MLVVLLYLYYVIYMDISVLSKLLQIVAYPKEVTITCDFEHNIK